jgi:hypothetical protein
MVDSRVLRKIFGPQRDKVTGQWRRLGKEELNDLYCSPNIFRVIKSRNMIWAGRVARMGGRRGVYRVLVRKPEDKRPLGRPRHGWEDNFKIGLQEVGWCVIWIDLPRNREKWCWTLLKTVMNLRVPLNAGNFLTN